MESDELVKQYSDALKSNMPQNQPFITTPNFDAYGVYASLFNSNGTMTIDLQTITRETITQHFNNILAILEDGVETQQVQTMKLYGIYADGVKMPFSIFDYFINLIFWYLPVYCNEPLTSNFFTFEQDGFTQNSIKSYIDTKFLSIHRTEYDNIWLNNVIDESVFRFKYIDEFSPYFMNTFNNEDTISLMEVDKEFRDAVHCDVTDVPMEDVKKIGMESTYKAIDRIKKSKFHYARPYFKSKQGINMKQFREFQVNIGTKPDGNGNVFPAKINSSYVNGGLNTLSAAVMDAEVARIAQILTKNNVGQSGAFARILGINNIDSKIYPDPKYVCNSKHFVELHVTDESVLNTLKTRYFRFTKNGIEYKTTSNPAKHNRGLIGKTILLRSPITCASHARGEGYCYRCYGDLAYTNSDINIGKLAAEEESSELTQRLLSAKHLLESSVKAMSWVPYFHEYFSVMCNIIMTIEGGDYKKWKLILNKDDIDLDDEMDLDSVEYNQYVTSYKIQSPTGEILDIHTADYNNMYIAKEFSDLLAKKKVNNDNAYVVNMPDLDGIGLFIMRIENIELQSALDDVTACIDKQATIKALETKDAILQKLVTDNLRSGLDVDSVHLEVILSNQCRRKDDILLNPEWEYENEECQMLSLKDALTNNPSVGISLEFNKLTKALYSPLTFRKSKASSVDLFYMTKPQGYMSLIPVESDIKSDKEEFVDPFTIVPEESKVTDSDID